MTAQTSLAVAEAGAQIGTADASAASAAASSSADQHASSAATTAVPANLRSTLRPVKSTASIRLVVCTLPPQVGEVASTAPLFVDGDLVSDKVHLASPLHGSSAMSASPNYLSSFNELPAAARRVVRDLGRSFQAAIADVTLTSLLRLTACLAPSAASVGATTSESISPSDVAPMARQLSAVSKLVTRNQMHLLYATRSHLALLSRLHSASLFVESISLPLIPSADTRLRFVEELAKGAFLPVRQFFFPDGQFFCFTSYVGAPPESSAFRALAPGVLPFWALLSIQSDQVATLCIHAPAMPTSEMHLLVERIRAGLAQTCHRVCQLMLLTSLNETRTCSALLLAPSADDEAASQDPILAAGNFSMRSANIGSASSSVLADPFGHLLRASSAKLGSGGARSTASARASGSAVSSTTKSESQFRAGQFSCPRVYKAVLPLHIRLPAIRALRALTGSSLHQFVVNNRHNLFVFQEQSGRIFYIRLSARTPSSSLASGVLGAFRSAAGASSVHATPLPSPLPSRSNSPTRDRVASASGGGDATTDPVLPSTSSAVASTQTSSTTGNSNTGGEEHLVLEVFGVDAPSEEVTVQLYNLLRSKLANMIFSIISTLLQRNPMFKLLAADIDVLHPPRSRPTASAALRLPASVTDVYLFILLLKANLAPFLNQLYLASGTGGLLSGDDEIDGGNTSTAGASSSTSWPAVPVTRARHASSAPLPSDAALLDSAATSVGIGAGGAGSVPASMLFTRDAAALRATELSFVYNFNPVTGNLGGTAVGGGAFMHLVCLRVCVYERGRAGFFLNTFVPTPQAAWATRSSCELVRAWRSCRVPFSTPMPIGTRMRMHRFSLAECDLLFQKI